MTSTSVSEPGTPRARPLPSGTPATLCEAFQNIAALDPSAVAIRTTGDMVRITWAQYAEQVRAYAAGFAELGVRRGDTVALMLVNRAEFHLLDTAALHLGAIPFSVYNTSSPEQIAYVLGHAASTVVVTERQFLPVIRASGAQVTHLICVDGAEPNTMSLNRLVASGDPEFDFDAAWRAVTPSDVATLIYTSGTTGDPKGVELTHGGLLAGALAVDQVLQVVPGDRTLSYLPSAHIADRLLGHYMQMTHGTQTTDVADLRAIADALPDALPTVWMAVPRVWDKIRFRIEAGIERTPGQLRRRVARYAVDLSLRRVRAHQRGARLGPLRELTWRVADRVVLSKLRAALGFGQLRCGMSGAAAISRETLEFFLALGVTVCEIWGLTETCAGTTVNPPGRIKIGTVGLPVPGVELRLAPDGEVLVRGPMMMKGYRNDRARTAEVLDADGWLSTGDIGTLDDEGYLTIVDRKKELIINAAGKNMSPTNIESTIKNVCPTVASAVVIGDNRPYNVALLVLDPEAAHELAARHGRPSSSPAELAADPAVLAEIEAGVAAANAKLSRAEQVKRYTVLPVSWDPGGDELTPTLKLRRRPIDAKYAVDIERLYA